MELIYLYIDGSSLVRDEQFAAELLEHQRINSIVKEEAEQSVPVGPFPLPSFPNKLHAERPLFEITDEFREVISPASLAHARHVDKLVVDIAAHCKRKTVLFLAPA